MSTIHRATLPGTSAPAARPPATHGPIGAAVVHGRNGRPAEVLPPVRIHAFEGRRGLTASAELPLYKDDNRRPDGYFTLDSKGRRHGVDGWSPAAAQRHAAELGRRWLEEGTLPASRGPLPQTHERVFGGDGAQHWIPVARRTRDDGDALFWAHRAAGIPTDNPPRGGTAEFDIGYRRARDGFNTLAGMAVLQTALSTAGLATAPLRLERGFTVVDGRSGNRVRISWPPGNGPNDALPRISATGIRADGSVLGSTRLAPPPAPTRTRHAAAAPENTTPIDPPSAAPRSSSAGAGSVASIPIPPARPPNPPRRGVIGSPEVGPGATGRRDGGQSDIVSTSGWVVQRQIQQQPQQAQRDRAAPSDRGEPERRARDYLRMAGTPAHLRLKSGIDGVAIEVARDRLDPEVRPAHQRLVDAFSGPKVDRMLGVLLGGHAGEVGLHALAEHWPALAGTAPLTGGTLVDLGRVIHDDARLETMWDLTLLTEFRAGTYRGIVTPTESQIQAAGWIDPNQDGFAHLAGLPSDPLSAAQLAAEPYLRQHIHFTRRAYDDEVAAQTRLHGSRSDRLPWASSEAPGFAESIAAREAFWLTLRSAGSQDSVWPILRRGESVPWERSVADLPGLAALDFSRTYPMLVRSLRDGLAAIMKGYHPVADMAEAGIGALEAATRTFRDPERRSQLFKFVSGAFTDPVAARIFANSPRFENAAQQLILDELDQMKVTRPFVLPWTREQFHSAVLASARERAGTPQTAQTRLAALEALVTEPTGQAVIDGLATASLRREFVERALIDRIASIPRRYGLQPREVEHEPARSFHEAIAASLSRCGIRARVEPGDVPLLVVEGASTGARWHDRQRNEGIARTMSDVRELLEEAEYPIQWKFADGSR